MYMPVIDRSYSILTWFSDNSNCEISLLQFLQYALELNFCWKKNEQQVLYQTFSTCNKLYGNWVWNKIWLINRNSQACLTGGQHKLYYKYFCKHKLNSSLILWELQLFIYSCISVNFCWVPTFTCTESWKPLIWVVMILLRFSNNWLSFITSIF